MTLAVVDELPILHPENLGKPLGAYHTQDNSDYPTRGLNKFIKHIGIRSWNQAYRGVNIWKTHGFAMKMIMFGHAVAHDCPRKTKKEKSGWPGKMLQCYIGSIIAKWS